MKISYLLSHHSYHLPPMSILALVGGICFFVGRRIYKKHKYHYKELKALGLFRDEFIEVKDKKTGAITHKLVKSKIKVKKKKNKYIFYIYNRAFSLQDFEKLIPSLEHIFGIKIDEMTVEKSILPFLQHKIILHCEAFKDILNYSECPNLEAGEYWLGKTGSAKNIVLDTIKKFQFAILVLGQAGAGKGNVACSIFQSLLDGWIKKTNSHPYTILCLDAKKTDYIPIFEKYKKYGEVKYLNPIFIEELEEAVRILEEYKTKVDLYRKYLSENGISVSHWFQIAKKYPHLEPPIKPILLLADELGAYLSPTPTIKITASSSPDEVDQKKSYDLRARLSFLIGYMVSLYRSTGSFFLLLNQSSTEGSLTLDRTSLRLLILSQQNSAQSRALTGSDAATDSTLNRGKFLFVGDGVVKKFQTSFILKDE